VQEKDIDMFDRITKGAVVRAMSAASALGGLVACAQVDQAANNIQVGQVVGGGTVQMRDVQPVGGFLPNPGALQPGGPGQAALVYFNPGVNMASYRRILLEPVAIWSPPDSQLSGVSAEQKRAVANTFYSDLYNAMSSSCEMTKRPTAGTLRIKVALVDAKIPNSAVNTVATYAPYASGAYSVASVAFNKGVGYFAGTATVEGYATDARTGTLAWEVVDKRGGTTAAVENTLDTWLDVHHSFEAWSVQIVKRLQEFGICQR
jgi:hypothetical protein